MTARPRDRMTARPRDRMTADLTWDKYRCIPTDGEHFHETCSGVAVWFVLTET